jgi:hypothetical protein
MLSFPVTRVLFPLTLFLLPSIRLSFPIRILLAPRIIDELAYFVEAITIFLILPKVERHLSTCFFKLFLYKT